MEEHDGVRDEIILKYLEGMVRIQRKLDGLRDEFNEKRREARGEGLNTEALNLLVPLLTKYPHDRAASALNEIIRYAQVYGAEVLAVRSSGGAVAGRMPEPGSLLPEPVIAASRADMSPKWRLGSFAQMAVSLSFAFALIWLLN